MGLSCELRLDLFLQVYELELDGEEDMAPVGGVRVVQASVSVWVCPGYIMQRLSHLAFHHLRVIRNMRPDAFIKGRAAS